MNDGLLKRLWTMPFLFNIVMSVVPVRTSICTRLFASDTSHNEMEWPFFPARPVRPMRCVYVSGVSGIL